MYTDIFYLVNIKKFKYQNSALRELTLSEIPRIQIFKVNPLEESP